MATHSSILAWRIPGTEEPGGLQSMGVEVSDTTHTHTLPSLMGEAVRNQIHINDIRAERSKGVRVSGERRGRDTRADGEVAGKEVSWAKREERSFGQPWDRNALASRAARRAGGGRKRP